MGKSICRAVFVFATEQAKKEKEKTATQKSDPTGRSNGWVHMRQTNRIQRSAQKAMPHVSA